MECPICFGTDCNIQLKCKHDFHMSCLKNWFFKGEAGNKCPMCRSNICFKGMNKTIKSWVEEKEIVGYEDVWNQELSDLFQSYEDVFEDVLKYDKNMFELVGEDLIEDILSYENLIKKCREFFEPQTFTDAVNDPDVADEILNLTFVKVFIRWSQNYNCRSGKTHSHIINNISHFTRSAFFNRNSNYAM